ncbi:MAG: hypothetical protein IT462_11195 [Planctomycetes bacterium]|nr:hypothetical protein [Planctomycetota bacterium]
MSDQVNAGGILAREWRILKPMPWLLMAAAGVLVFATVYPSLRGESPPAPLVIHKEEKLAPAEIDFEILKELAAFADSFRPLVAYRVAPKEGKAFSHPFTLNFQGDAVSGVWKHPAKPALAKLEDGKWVLSKAELTDKTSGATRYFAAEFTIPGTYALGFVIPEPPQMPSGKAKSPNSAE